MSNFITTRKLILLNFLQIDDKRISKHHGEITVLDNQIKIKSCHKNPIFIKKGSEASEILDLNAEINLNNDDCFLLLPDDFEFKVKIENSANDQVESSSSTSGPFRIREIAEINDNLEAGAMPVTLSQILRDLPDEDTAQPQVTSSSSSRKRSIESEIAEEPKKIKIEPQEVTDTASTSADANSTTKVESKINPDSTNPQLPSTSNIKQEPDSSNVKTECTTNDPPPAQSVRPSCSHGIRCFRNNAEHRRDFAHPGDNEYRRPEYPQAAPNAPRCPYWEACYRRNPDHFHMFEHPPSCKFVNFTNFKFNYIC